MTSRSQKLVLAILVAALAALVVIWAINGFDDTWLYAVNAVIIIIAIPISWLSFGKKDKNQ